MTTQAETRFLAISIGFSTVLVVATEILSLSRLFLRPMVIAVWLAAAVTIAACAAKWTRAPQRWAPAQDPVATSLLVVVALFWAATGVTALFGVPTTWDSLTYHLPRAMHWVQRGAVEHYPTNIDRQNYQPPFAEIGIAHLYMLVASDRLANLVQWLAYVGTGIGAYVLAGRLGAGRRGRLGAALFLATAPMAVVQGSSTQNDLVLAFWLVAAGLLVHRLSESSKLSWPEMALTGAAGGLAALTKGTGLLFVAPLAVWALVALVRNHPWKRVVLLGGVAAVCALLVAGPHYLRNITAYGSPSGPAAAALLNGTADPRATVSNMVRNLALQVAVPGTDTDERVVSWAVSGTHRLLGIGLNDPDTTYAGTQFRPVAGLPRSDDISPSPFHWGFLMLVLPLSIARKGGTRSLGIAVLAGFVLFAAVLRWQPWHSRLLLPLIALGSPLVAIEAERRLRQPIMSMAAALLIVTALPWLLLGENRPLFGGGGSVLAMSRHEQQFRHHTDIEATHVGVAEAVRGCREIGLKVGGDYREYPLWGLVKPYATASPRILHVVPGSPGAQAQQPDCLFVATADRSRHQIVLEGASYTRSWYDENGAVFRQRE